MDEAWWAAAVGLVPGAASFGWVAWRWWFERADKRHDRSHSREERLQRELETQRAALSKEQAELFDRMRTELARAEAGRADAERTADQWAWLARWWHRFAHDLFHVYRRIAHELRNVHQRMVWLKARYPEVVLPETGEVPPRDEPPLSVEDPIKPEQSKP